MSFNVQILNSERFSQVTGFAPPNTPISAQTYAAQGLPFFDIYNEKSVVKGDYFEGIKSIKTIDKEKAEDDVEEEDEEEDEDEDEEATQTIGGKRKRHFRDDKAVENPVVLLNHDGSGIGFKPVSVVKEELKAMNHVQF